ncbi:MAG: AAA family ATPase [Nitrososphaerales archaeon]
MKIAIISSNAGTTEGIRYMLQAGGDQHSVSFHEGSLEQIERVAKWTRPDLIIADYRNGTEDGVGKLENADVAHLDAKLIILCDSVSPDFVIGAMRAGVKDVLRLPVTADVLRAAIGRIEQSLTRRSLQQGGCQVLSFISAKSGAGTTFLATNLAYTLAVEQNRKVALLDLNRQFGDALMFLSDQTPATTLADVAHNIQRLDAAFLASSMTQAGPGLDVLAAPNNPVEGMEVRPEHIDRIVGMARELYDFVVLDVGCNFDAQTIKALDQADAIYAVMQVSLPVIRDARRLLDVFHTLDYPNSKIHPVVNRYARGGEIQLPDLEKSLGMKLSRVVPNHYDAVTASINQGIPIGLLSKTSPVTKALNQWSASLVQSEKQEEIPWFKRMLKRYDLERGDSTHAGR